MKLVILSSRFPYPLEKGDKLRLFHQLAELSKHHEIHLISLTEEEIAKKDRDVLESLCFATYPIKLNEKQAILNALKSIFNLLPFQVNYFFNSNVQKQINKIIRSVEPDVIYCQLARMAEYCRHLYTNKVIDYMDCFSSNYVKRAHYERFPKNIFFKIEANRLAHYEKDIAHHFEARTIISERDLQAIDVEEKISIISNGIDTTYFKKSETDKKAEMLFVGNMGYHPNVLAAKYLVEEIKPRLSENLTIRIAGARPTKAIKSLTSETVTITGWVDDIRVEYGAAKLFVAPIFSGAGQQNKILEAMSMEMICLTTPIVNAAIGAVHSEHLLIANNAAEFAKLIEEVQGNIDLYKNMGQKARAFVKENFSWQAENKKLNDIITNVAKRKNEK